MGDADDSDDTHLSLSSTPDLRRMPILAMPAHATVAATHPSPTSAPARYRQAERLPPPCPLHRDRQHVHPYLLAGVWICALSSDDEVTYCGRIFTTDHAVRTCAMRKCLRFQAPMTVERHFHELGYACAGCHTFVPMVADDKRRQPPPSPPTRLPTSAPIPIVVAVTPAMGAAKEKKSTSKHADKKKKKKKPTKAAKKTMKEKDVEQTAGRARIKTHRRNRLSDSPSTSSTASFGWTFTD